MRSQITVELLCLTLLHHLADVQAQRGPRGDGERLQEGETTGGDARPLYL